MAEVNVTGTTNLNVTPESEQITIGNSSVEASEQVAPAGSGGYHEISIPDELFQEQSTQESDTEQAVTTESEEPAETQEAEQEVSDSEPEQTEAVSEPTDEDDKYVYETEDGSRYTLDDVETWRKDSLNRHDWSKSNTEKAQQLADQRRAVEPLVQLIEKIKENGDFTETLREAIEDEIGKEAGQLFQDSLSMENTELPNPYQDQLLEAEERLATIEAERELDNSLVQLQNTFSLTSEQADDVLAFAIKVHEDTDRLLTLEEAYKVMNFDKVKAEPVAEKPKPNVPVNITKNAGVKESASKPKTYADIDVASFFNQ